MAKDKTVAANGGSSSSTIKSPAPVTTLADLQKLCAQKKRVEFTLDGTPCSLEVRRLTPAEESQVNAIVESVIPPVVKGKTPEEDRLDMLNPDYQKRKTEAEIRARALGLYLAVPAFNEANPGLKDINQITDYVQGQLTGPVLNALWQGVSKTGINLAELVNFT